MRAQGWLGAHGGALGTASVFTLAIPADGNYEVRMLYNHASNRAQNARIIIRSADGEKTVTLNQRHKCLVDGVPRTLGVFKFTKGQSGSVEISNGALRSVLCKRWDLGIEANGIDLKAIDLLGSLSMFVDGNPQFI